MTLHTTGAWITLLPIEQADQNSHNTSSARTYRSIPPPIALQSRALHFYVLFFLGLLLALTTASADLILPSSQGGGNAVVLVGDVEGASNELQNAASEAVSDLSDAGFNTSLDRDATLEEAVSAIENDQTRVVVIFAHGDGDTKKSSFNEGMLMADGNWLDSAVFGGRTFPNIQRVILHGCGQRNQQSWRILFPNAVINGWAGPVRGWQIYWWQFFFTADANPPTPLTDTRLASIETRIVGGRTVATIGSPIDPPFQMSPALSAAFGSQTMNIFGTDDKGLNEVLLVGLTVDNGRVTAFDDGGYISTSFDVRVKYSDMFNAFENPNTIVDAFNAGRIAIDIHQPGLDEQIMFDGFAAVNFGVNATVPTCEITSEVKLGEKGIISCTGFTPNADVKVIFHRPDNSTSEDLGKADGYGNFNGSFTVAVDRPTGPWTLYLIDLFSGYTVVHPFTVIPTVAVVPTATPVISAATPVPTATPVISTATPVPAATPVISTATPASTSLRTIADILWPGGVILIILIALIALIAKGLLGKVQR